MPLQSRSYPIWIDNGILKTLPELLQPMNQGQVWVIFSQEGIFSQHGHTIEDALQSRGFKTTYIQMPEGEEAKSLTSMSNAFSHILAAGCDRSSTFLAFLYDKENSFGGNRRRFSGNPEQIVADIKEYENLGVSHIVLDTRSADLNKSLEKMDWLSEEVMSSFR